MWLMRGKNNQGLVVDLQPFLRSGTEFRAVERALEEAMMLADERSERFNCN